MLDRDFDGRATRAKQELSHFRVRLALHRIAVDGRNPVAESQSGASGGRLRGGGADGSVGLGAVAKVFNRGSDTEIFRALLSAERSVLNWIEIGRVWIQDAQHSN